MMRAGILPLRKPGTVTWLLIFLYAASRLGLSSSKGTSTVSRTRVGFRVSTALFTVGSPWGFTLMGADLRPFGAARASGTRYPAVPRTRSPAAHPTRTTNPTGRGRPAGSRPLPRNASALVGVAGFEPTAFRSQSGRATKLRHTPLVRHVEYM